jgi:SNF2 family DNA or RNA helicase
MQNHLENFTKIYEKEIVLHKIINDNDIRLIYGDYRKLMIIDVKDIPNEIRRNIYAGNIKTYAHTEHFDNIVKFYYPYNEYIVYPYLDYKTKDEMAQEHIYYIKRYNQFLNLPDLSKVILVAKLEKVEDKYYVIYYFNTIYMNAILTNNRTLSKNLFISILTSQKKENVLKKSAIELSDIQNDTTINIDINNKDLNNLSLLKEGITLFNYQKTDVTWMNTIEKNVINNENAIDFNYSHMFPILNGDYMLYNNNILPKSLINKDCYDGNFKFKYYGGNLISDVGLGKTLIALYHILSNDIEKRNYINHFVDFEVCCNYFFKRGPRKGRYCSKEPDRDSLYCKEHKNTLFVDKRVLKYENLNDFNINDFKTDGFIKTNATLVICPNQLCDQWVNEYYDKFKNNHRIIHIVTYDQWINLTLGDFLFADIVFVSYNFLLNSNYVKYVKQKNCIEYVDKYFKPLEYTKDVSYETSIENLLNSKIFNILHLYQWRRVFLDEAHEIENKAKSNVLKQDILNFKSIYKWNITGTPFTNGINSFIKLLSYNTTHSARYGSVDDTSDENYFYINSLGFDNNIINKCKFLFRKNTKESVKIEYEGNIIKEYMKKLIFTTQEKAIYDSYVNGSNQKYYDFLIKLCCHSELYDSTKSLIKNCKTFEEIQKVLLDYNKKRLDTEKMEILQTERDIYNLEEQMVTLEERGYFDTERYDLWMVSTRTNIASKKRHLTSVKKNAEIIERTYNYLKAAIESLHNEETTCPICLDNIEKGQVTITKCGHKFCWDCIFETHKSKNHDNFKCPSCNTMLTTNEIYLINEKNNELDELEGLIHSIKSTKIGNIIHFLKNDTKDTDKIILFSQWDELLHKVGDILSEYKFKIVYCQGSVFQRKRAISSFQKDPSIRIIMLSSRNAASGINLTIANKIILLEPVYGSFEYRKNIEEQAIGRADRIGQKSPIDVYRFIIKDTIEEDIINNSENINIKSLTI